MPSPSPSAAWTAPTPAKHRTTIAIARSFALTLMMMFFVRISGMGRHPFRYRLGLLVAKVGIDPQEGEVAEIDQRHDPAESVLDERQVRFGAEQLGNPLGRLAGADGAEEEERDGEDAERDLEAAAAVADRL